MDVLRHLVVGLQGSGKTTFAAALWYLLDSREVDTVLKKGSHNGDFRYLEEIAGLWGDGWRSERTTISRQENIRINLLDERTKIQSYLEFTDLAGESFEKTFATRRCETGLIELVQAAEGILVFVSARRKVDDHTLLDFATGVTDRSQEAVAVEVDPDFDPAKVPHQVQIVDLLQALSAKPFQKKMPPVAVVISAWDLARANSPEEWLANNMPLLDQFIRSNVDSFVFQLYGVSAQGGELPKKEDGPESMKKERQAALGLPRATDRIRVVGDVKGQHDLTELIAWLSYAGKQGDGK